MSIERVRRFFTTVSAVAMIALAPSAHADAPPIDPSAEARRQYELGTQSFAQKAYIEAAQHFEAAASLKPNAIALYTAALAWDLAEKSDRAADAFARALDVPGLDAQKTATVKDRLAELERTLGTLVVAAPEGWKVGLDQANETAAPVRLHGQPGIHAVHVHAPGRPVERRETSFEAGVVKPLDLINEPSPPPVEKEPEPAPPPPPPPEPRPAEFWTTSRAVGVGVLGAGLAALGAGAILGVNANDAKDSYVAAPTRAAFDHATSLQTWTNVALISGAVLAAGGIVLIALPLGTSDRRAELRAAPGGFVVGGSF